MADRTLCTSTTCPKSGTCARHHEAEWWPASSYAQAYADFTGEDWCYIDLAMAVLNVLIPPGRAPREKT